MINISHLSTIFSHYWAVLSLVCIYLFLIKEKKLRFKMAQTTQSKLRFFINNIHTSWGIIQSVSHIRCCWVAGEWHHPLLSWRVPLLAAVRVHVGTTGRGSLPRLCHQVQQESGSICYSHSQRACEPSDDGCAGWRP